MGECFEAVLFTYPVGSNLLDLSVRYQVSRHSCETSFFGSESRLRVREAPRAKLLDNLTASKSSAEGG